MSGLDADREYFGTYELVIDGDSFSYKPGVKIIIKWAYESIPRNILVLIHYGRNNFNPFSTELKILLQKRNSSMDEDEYNLIRGTKSDVWSHDGSWVLTAEGGGALAWDTEPSQCPENGDWSGGYGATISCLDESKF